MRIRFGTQGRVEAPALMAASVLLAILLLAVAGCGTRKAEQASGGAKSQGETSEQATVVAAGQEASMPSESRRAGRIHRIKLTNRGCIRFDPQWTNVRLGQSITWQSELKSPLRIYVSPGVFSRESYLVRPGATVSTGPALASGRYSFWTEPTACREAPRGVLLAGPGVRVRETFLASAPGVR